MIELLTWATPNGSRPSIMLEEVGLPYTVTLVDITTGAQFDPEFMAVSPNNKIPALLDYDEFTGRRVLFESGAILIYLAEKTGRLLASEGPRRDEALSWLFWGISGVGPALGRFMSDSGTVTPLQENSLALEVSRLMHVLERRLEEVQYLAHDYSIADIAVFSWLKLAFPEIKERLGETLGKTEEIDRWLAAISARPAVQRGLRAPKVILHGNTASAP